MASIDSSRSVRQNCLIRFKIEKCRNLSHLKSSLISFDPGAISVPGVLNGSNRTTTLRYSGAIFRCIPILRPKEFC
jgi:hypothetical protein